MFPMNLLLKIIISVLAAYLLGSILPAYFFARAKGFDIRERGTGNPGIGNAATTMGYGAAVQVAFFDILKAPLAMLLVNYLKLPSAFSFLCGFVVVLGHIAPFYLKFKGGKGAATTMGIIGFAVVLLLRENLN